VLANTAQILLICSDRSVQVSGFTNLLSVKRIANRFYKDFRGGKMKRLNYSKATKTVFFAFWIFLLLSVNIFAADFPANAGTLGAIPDYPTGQPSCHITASLINKDITFTVSGITGAPTNVEIKNLTFSPAHTWTGDIVATLIAPNGTQSVVFGRIGATTATGVGTASDLAGPYGFRNTSDPNIWSVSATTPLPSNTYSAVVSGGSGVSNPAPTVDLDAAFAGVANPNGTWTLRLTDGCDGDTGSVSAVTLTVDGAAGPPPAANADFNGDGRTDYSVLRDVSGQIQWLTSINGSGSTSGIAWGTSATDVGVAEDFDGDGKDDVAVWRPISTGQPSGNAFFYVLRSSDSTFQSIDFGQSNDNPTVVADYDGDGKADPAVYRCPPFLTGDGQCFYYYKASNANPSGNITFVPWGFGETGDFFPIPGDFDGDGKNDVCIQRGNPSAPTAGQFVLRRSSDSVVEYVNWGNSTDFVIPGDYDGDGKDDFCVRRTVSGQRHHFILERDGGGTGANPIIWGITGDISAPGDYDGDGKQDIAVWRENVNPDQNFFYVRRSSDNGLTSFEWGQNGDSAIASWYVQ
jgi:subtilisin-like proprotein convertase family protein